MHTPDRLSTLGFAGCTALATVTLGQGGDNATTAVPLGLDTPTSGTTLDYTNDSDEVCPYSGSTAPDVYYVYTPSADHTLTVDVCESGYDTKTYVYDSSLELLATTVFGDPSCDDDSCSSSGGGMFRSLIECVPVAAGLAYFVVVDGFGGEAGPYTIVLADALEYAGDPAHCDVAPPCEVDCNGTDENEPCNEGGDDTVNGGCNSPDRTAFGEIVCDSPICGQSYFNGTTRDTDWFKNVTPFTMSYNVYARAEFEAIVGRVENGGVDDCTGVSSFAEVVVGEFGCEELTFTTPELPPGTYWFFIAANFTETVTCATPDDSEYVLQLVCGDQPPCPWDFNGNGAVDLQDLLKLLAEWGPCPGPV